jgi:DNA repair ATPase RecN
MPVYLKDINAVDNGAHFLNADLHIHSYGASKDVKDATMTPAAIIDAAVAQGLGVIAITDHNTDQNLAAAVTHAQKYADRLLFIPGVEVTTANGHLLVYFAPEKLGELGRFLAKLDLVGEKGAEQTHTKKSMADTIGEAERLGGICIAAHIDREKTGFETLATGFPNWKRDIITSPGLYGVEIDSTANLAWYSGFEEPGSAAGERAKLMEARASSAALAGRAELARLQGSDAHSMAKFQITSPDKPWTRIKLNELSFAAFRTALVDPTARVVAKASVPRSFPRLLGMAITGGFLADEIIHFSDNLNCFIGGRGTGKTTALRALAHCFGIDDEFGGFETCPDAVVVYCQDADGIIYRYERARGGEVAVTVKEEKAITKVPVESFRIEYFGQGELARVAEDPLNTPQLFQDFLDRHLNLSDLVGDEASLVQQVRNNAARREPLENATSTVDEKKKKLGDIETKLKVAEEGKLQEIVGAQSHIASEKVVVGAIENVIAEYKSGLSLAVLNKDFEKILKTAGQVTGDAASKVALEAMRRVIETANAGLVAKAAEVNTALKTCAAELEAHTKALKLNHAKLEGALAEKIADLKAKGLAGNLAELDQLLKQKTAIGKDVSAIEQRGKELEQCRTERDGLLASLKQVREEMAKRRKDQLLTINQNLAKTITEYKVFVKYDDAGIIDDFLTFILKEMNGTYFQDESAKQLCQRVSPANLADWVLERNVTALATASGLPSPWPERLVERMCYWRILFELEVLAKPPKPVITVHTKTTPPKIIPVGQLSDGQRHTILLTIALLAESNVPLVIDQPEDDLDNAFIFSSIVRTLRTVKERRQVVLITHNANIAVLGDSELLLPMKRESDCGKAIDRGSIDRESTKKLVQNILEGGADAFKRRKEIYGH